MLVPVDEMSHKDARKLLRNKGPSAAEFNMTRKRQFGSMSTKIYYWWLCFLMALQSNRLLYLVYFNCLSYAGALYHEIFYTIQLLDIIQKFPTLTFVIQSITMNKYQLLNTALLGFIVIYIYATLGFYFLQDDYLVGRDLETKEHRCQSILLCFMVTTNRGLRRSGGIGDDLEETSKDDTINFYSRWAFDLTFFLICVVLILNIVFGIIINNFGTLRDDRRKFLDIMGNFCFICNIERQKFDSNLEGGFDKHVKSQHHLWNYIYYMAHLQLKASTEYNAVECSVTEKLRRFDTSWLPFHKALALEKVEETKHQDSDNIEQIRALEQQLLTQQEEMKTREATLMNMMIEMSKKIELLACHEDHPIGGDLRTKSGFDG